MSSPFNTRNLPPEAHLLGMLAEGQSNYITNMEADGQRQLVASSTLPIDGPWDELTALGFVRGGAADDLFCKVTLPTGWTREGGDHAMWSYVCDERGIQRVAVFYKAAFYDRHADMHLTRPGYTASTRALYGDDDEAALPEKWDVFTDDERADFIAGLDRMDADIAQTPTVFGKHAARLAQIRALVASVSA